MTTDEERIKERIKPKVNERIKNCYGVSTIYDHPKIIFCTNRDILGYFKSLSRDPWYNMKLKKDESEDHNLIKLGWIDGNFWSSVFDSTFNNFHRFELQNGMLIQLILDLGQLWPKNDC